MNYWFDCSSIWCPQPPLLHFFTSCIFFMGSPSDYTFLIWFLQLFRLAFRYGSVSHLPAEVPSHIWQINIVSMPGPQLIIMAKRELGYFWGWLADWLVGCLVDWKAVACLWRTDWRMTECLSHTVWPLTRVSSNPLPYIK